MKHTSIAIKPVASAYGLDPSSTVALMSAVLNGLVGPSGRVTGLSEPEFLPYLNVALVGDDGTAEALVEALMQPVRMLQQEAEARYPYVDRQRLRDALIQLNPELEAELAKPFSELEQALSGDALPVYAADRGFAGLFRSPLEFEHISDELASRVEFLLRPRVLIEAPEGPRLSAALARCHRSHALIYAGRSLTLSDLGTRRGVPVYFELCMADNPRPARLSRCGLGYPGDSRSSWILHGEEADWKDPRTPYFVQRTLLLEPSRRADPAAENRRGCPDALEVWERAVSGVLQARIDGSERFPTPPAPSFQRRYRAYVEECSSTGVSSVAVRALPLFIHNLFHHLARHAGSSVPGELGVDAVFHHAEVLRSRDRETRRRLKNSREMLETIELANRLYDRIQAMRPLKLRSLMRTLNDQRTKNYLPTLDKMIRAKLVVEWPRKTYWLGPERDLEGALRRLWKQDEPEATA